MAKSKQDSNGHDGLNDLDLQIKKRQLDKLALEMKKLALENAELEGKRWRRIPLFVSIGTLVVLLLTGSISYLTGDIHASFVKLDNMQHDLEARTKLLESEHARVTKQDERIKADNVDLAAKNASLAAENERNKAALAKADAERQSNFITSFALSSSAALALAADAKPKIQDEQSLKPKSAMPNDLLSKSIPYRALLNKQDAKPSFEALSSFRVPTRPKQPESWYSRLKKVFSSD
ncbi:MAG TPA: hypothetical protein DC054_04870 [Blastocatellia bacterium]|nr:hypothetical protein [Blastocatellia bacterium]